MNIILLTLCCIGLMTITLFELLQIFPKIAGGLINKNGLAANYALKTLLFNRFGATLFFPIVAYYVDSGAKPDDIAMLMLVGMILLCTATMILLVYYENIIGKYMRIINKNYAKESTQLILYEDLSFSKNNKFYFLVFGAGIFGHLGILAPILVASIIPEFRLTVSQFGFLFNSVFSVITIYYIDAKISRFCENEQEKLRSVGRLILRSRLSSMVFMCAILSGVAAIF